MIGRRRGSVALGIGAAGFAAVLALYLVNFRDSGQPQVPPLGQDVPQHSVAEASGIRLEAIAAGFDGLSTYLAVRVTLVDEAIVAVPGAETVVLFLPEHMMGGTVRPPLDPQSAAAATGETTLLVLGPTPLSQEPYVTVSRLGISSPGSALELIDGPWTLLLETPSDLAQRLRLEELGPAYADDAGVRLEVRGVRSVAETLLTVQVLQAPAGLQPIVPVEVRIDGAWDRCGHSFRPAEAFQVRCPATPFGEPVDLRFGPWSAHGDVASGASTVRLGDALRDASVAGQVGDFLQLDARHIDRSGAGVELTAVHFGGDVRAGGGGRPGTIVLEIGENFGDNFDDAPRLLDAHGDEVPVDWFAAGYYRDETGTILSGYMMVTYQYGDDLDRLEVITVVSPRAPLSILRGNWSLTLSP